MTLLLKDGSSPLGAGSAFGPRQDLSPEGVLTEGVDEGYSVIALDTTSVAVYLKQKKHRCPTRSPVLFLLDSRAVS